MLVKPQFEAGPELVGRGGLVRDPQVHAAVIRDVAGFFEELGFGALGVRAPRSPGAGQGTRSTRCTWCEERGSGPGGRAHPGGGRGG